MPAQQRPSWTIYPLSRHQPHDGLAVVSQPNGYGLHIWLQTDTRQAGICRPRWIVDAARLFNGNGTAPFSSGLASRAEFFEAVARPDVVRALRRELEQLCARRAPASTWQWQDPPRSPAEVPRSTDPFGDQEELQPLPAEIRRQEEAILRGDAPPTSP